MILLEGDTPYLITITRRHLTRKHARRNRIHPHRCLHKRRSKIPGELDKSSFRSRVGELAVGRTFHEAGNRCDI